MTVPLYRRVLGPRFDLLPPRVRALHDLTRPSVWRGRADVARGRSLPARLAALLTGLPPQGPDQPLEVVFEPVGATEVWSRRFGASLFRTTQSLRGACLCERAGPATFVFRTLAGEDGLALRLDGLRLLGLPLPRVLHPKVRTFERERDGRYEFEVEAHLPLFGLLVRYAGWLEPSG